MTTPLSFLVAISEVDAVAEVVIHTTLSLLAPPTESGSTHTLHLVHVVDVLPGASRAIQSSKQASAIALRTNGEAILERWASMIEAERGVRPQVHLEFGPPGIRTVELATRLRPDLLVIGSLDKSMLARVAFGSNAEHVLTKAPCSVLLARPRRA